MSISSAPPARPRWLVAGVPAGVTGGGSARAHHVFGALIEATGADVVGAYGRRGLAPLVGRIALASAGWLRRVELASTQLVPAIGLTALRGAVHARLLDLHDHPGLQLSALGVKADAQLRRRLDDLFARNVAAFEDLVVPSASFAELCGLEADRVVVATNGTDSDAIAPGPEPAGPVVAMISGAAPGRGIELLVAATERVRSDVPEARLRLALQPTGPASSTYLRDLESHYAGHGWVTIERIPHGRLSAFLAEASVLAIPHPPDAYLDASTPVKLFDGMAAGRPTVVTPRHETAAIIERTRAGLVTGGDTVDEMAAGLARLLSDDALRGRLGANARTAAVNEFDWRVISARLARALGVAPGGGS